MRCVAGETKRAPVLLEEKKRLHLLRDQYFGGGDALVAYLFV